MTKFINTWTQRKKSLWFTIFTYRAVSIVTFTIIIFIVTLSIHSKEPITLLVTDQLPFHWLLSIYKWFKSFELSIMKIFWSLILITVTTNFTIVITFPAAYFNYECIGDTIHVHVLSIDTVYYNFLNKIY